MEAMLMSLNWDRHSVAAIVNTGEGSARSDGAGGHRGAKRQAEGEMDFASFSLVKVDDHAERLWCRVGEVKLA